MLAEAAEFKTFDADLRRVVLEIFSCIGQTAVDENGFKVQREAEHKSFNCTMSDSRRCSSSILSKVATTRFNYNEVPNWENEPIPAGFKTRDMKAMYRSKVSHCSGFLKEVVGTKQTPEWNSPAPSRECIPDSDLDLCRELQERDSWGEAGTLFVACLLSGKKSVVRNKVIHGDKWFLPLADSGHPTKFGWPLVKKNIGTITYWELQGRPSVVETPFLHVYRLDEWEACEFVWESALCRMTRHGVRTQVGDGLVARLAGDALPLLKHSALQAFFDLSKTALLALCKELGCEVDPGDNLLQRLQRLIRFVLGDLL